MSRIGSGLSGAVRGGIYGGVGGAAIGGLGTETMRVLPSMQFAANRQARVDKATHPQTYLDPINNWFADKLDAGKEMLYNNQSRLGQHESVRADLNTRQSPLRHVYDNPFSRQGGTYLDALSKQFGVK